MPASPNFGLLLLLFLLLSVLTIHAQPKGVSVSAGPKNANSSSVTASNASLSFVDGILVRVGWDDPEPTDDNFDWSLISNQIDWAQVYGIKISVGVGAGKDAPPDSIYAYASDTIGE